MAREKDSQSYRGEDNHEKVKRLKQTAAPGFQSMKNAYVDAVPEEIYCEQ